MGVTTDQLNKLLKAGQVASSDFLPAFAKELRRTVRETGALEAGQNSLVASQNRLNSTFFSFTRDLGKAGAEKGFQNLFEDLTVSFNTLFGDPKEAGKRMKIILSGLGEMIKLVARLISPLATVAGALIDVVGAIVEGEDAMDGLSSSSKVLASALRPVVGFFKVIVGLISKAVAGYEGLIELSKNIGGVVTLVDPITGAAVGTRDIENPFTKVAEATPEINPLGISGFDILDIAAKSGLLGSVIQTATTSNGPAGTPTIQQEVNVFVDGVRSEAATVETKENFAAMGTM